VVGVKCGKRAQRFAPRLGRHARVECGANKLTND
jgi:hypothetical protein